jgi:hypothetical protein
MQDDKPYWFEAKRYGLGWTFPVTWQGWLVVILFLAVCSTGIYLIDNRPYFWAFQIVMIVALVAVAAWKGERPFKWRWGSD